MIHLLEQTEGQEWRRHRKITAAAFNERNNSLVWSESLGQAQEMIQYWSQQKHGINTAVDDTRTLALHVFTYAGFGQSQGFRAVTEPSQGFSMTIQEALATMIGSPVRLALLANISSSPV